MALGASRVLALFLLFLALVASSKDCPLCPISTSSSPLAGSPQFGSCLH